MFSGLISLHTLFICHNNLNFLGRKVFSNVPKLHMLYIVGNHLLSFDVRVGVPLESLNIFITDIPELCCYVSVSTHCSVINQINQICVKRRIVPAWYIISIGLFAVNLVIFLFRFQRFYKDCLSVLVQSINLTDFLLALHYINRIVYASGNIEIIFEKDTASFMKCLLSSGIFVFVVFNHLLLCVAHSCIHLFIQKSAILKVKIVHGITVSIVLISISSGISFLTLHMSSVIGVLCLPVHDKSTSSVAIIIMTCFLLGVSVVAYTIMNILTIMFINSTRNKVGRKKTKEEQNLTIRIILNILLNSIYYPIFGSIFSYTFATISINQIAILLMDLILFLRSISTAVLYTFATKSFDKILRGFHGPRRGWRAHNEKSNTGVSKTPEKNTSEG